MMTIAGVKLYSVNDVAQMMGVSRNSVYSYFSKGLKSRKLSGKRYITEENLKAFLMEDDKK